MTRPSRVVAFVPDLMDRSKVLSAARAAGVTIEAVTAPSGLGPAIDAGASLVLVDLSRLGDLGELSVCRGTPTVGFGSHVDRQLLEAAADAGCSQVLPRSAFFRRLPELVSAATSAGAGTPGEGQDG
ncbi:MAG: hypothetical protein J2P59_00245 [Acidimicrobiales bacterium]|nr:hypothetical protein [Acidimicrobiales bacterium]MBO0887048.1 hypothetical protein [Acidimicrobiales bacterium]